MAPTDNSSASTSAASGLTVRAATPDDDDAVLQLLHSSMGWVPDGQHRAFFHWKHRANPHGHSPAWVALDGTHIVGFRTFLRWTFHYQGRSHRAVRAVDTATHPDYQGRGIFSRLTRSALDELADAGVDWVFNTPNDRSLPGYLKMGWQEVGRLPVSFRPRSPLALPRLARARTPADKWSIPPDARRRGADPAAQAALLDVADAIDRAGPELLEPSPAGDGSGTAADSVRTHRTPTHLTWRYGFDPLHYRALPLDDDPACGLVIFRLRHRGPALEAAICELLLPSNDHMELQERKRRQAVRNVLRATGADHAVQLAAARPALGTLPLPGQGPLLVHRSWDGSPPPATWRLDLGDVELF